jgi:hypothetical protein
VRAEENLRRSEAHLAETEKLSRAGRWPAILIDGRPVVRKNSIRSCRDFFQPVFVMQSAQHSFAAKMGFACKSGTSATAIGFRKELIEGGIGLDVVDVAAESSAGTHRVRSM